MMPEVTGYPVLRETGVKDSIVSQDADHHIFACSLAEMTLVRQDPESYLPALFRRQTEFVTCLINGRNEKVTFDLRFISQPSPDSTSRNDIRIAFLCRIDQASVDEANHYAADFLNLLRSAFEECDFKLEDADGVASLLAPFKIQEAVRIRRRASMESLDTLRSGRERKVLGYRRPEELDAAVRPQQAATVFHVFPFLATIPDYKGLFQLLLLHSEPIAISVRLRPTVLSTDEERFIEEQIAA